MIAIPLQSFGAGDVIFTQELMSEFIESGYTVIYPVEPHFVEGFQKAYPRVTFVPKDLVKVDFNNKTDYEKDGIRYLPIRFADQIMGRPYKDVMKSKYELYGFDWKVWRNTMYTRDAGKEAQLALQLRLPEQYNLVSRYFGTTSQFKAGIKIDNALPVVEMRTLQGYSLFDWSYIIENATYIHAASSSILYLLELLDLEAREIHLYSRKPIEPHFDNVSYLFTKPYILHV